MKVSDMIPLVDLDALIPEIIYPIYKKHGNSTSLMYVMFTDLNTAECLESPGPSAAWEVGYKTSDTLAHTDSVWKEWCGPKPAKIYNIKDFK